MGNGLHTIVLQRKHFRGRRCIAAVLGGFQTQAGRQHVVDINRIDAGDCHAAFESRAGCNKKARHVWVFVIVPMAPPKKGVFVTTYPGSR